MIDIDTAESLIAWCGAPDEDHIVDVDAKDVLAGTRVMIYRTQRVCVLFVCGGDQWSAQSP